MSKISVCGDAIAIYSSLKLSDLRMVERFRPESLMILNEDKEPVFVVGTTDGCGTVNEFGMSFGSESHDDNKFATITLCGHGIVGDVKEYIADNYGGAIAKLNEIEARIPGVLSEIKAAKQRVMDSVTIQ